MEHAETTAGIPAPLSSDQPFSQAPHRRYNWLTNQNPFYLLSAACVLHSTGWSFGGAEGLPAWLTPLLIAAYVLLMAVAAVVIVRCWHVWDDARTILVTLLILFLELALSLDQFALQSPRQSVIAMLGGWLFAILLCESLLLGLRMRLPGLYRLSFHLQLALLFAAPLLFASGAQQADQTRVSWLLVAYAGAIAGPIFLLWPAVRQGRQAVTPNGTPWSWPCYPWTIPTVMSLVLFARSYSLCLTFDAAPTLTALQAYDQFVSVYAGYFAVPLLLAWGLIILEAGIVTKRRFWQGSGLAIPAVAFCLSLAPANQNIAAAELTDRITQTVGSPAWWTLWAASLFYLAATVRKVPGAARLFVVAVATATVVTSETVSWAALTPWPPVVWLAFAFVAIVMLVITRKTQWAMEAGFYACLAYGLTPWLPHGNYPPLLVTVNLYLVCLTGIAILSRERWMDEFRNILRMLFCLLATAVALQAIAPLAVWWEAPAYLAFLATLSSVIWLMFGKADDFGLTKYSLLCCYCVTFLQGFYGLEEHYRWKGLPAFAAGLALFHVGLLISSWKAKPKVVASTKPAQKAAYSS